MDKADKFDKALKERNVFFKYTFEDAVLRTDLKEGAIYVKLRGSEEFKAKNGSALVAEALMERNEITEAQYKAFA